MNRLILGVMLTCAVLSVEASDDESIYGTYSVIFHPGQSSGVLHSCSLGYQAVYADYVNRNGNPTQIIGNIGVRKFDANMILTLKIGIKDIADQNASLIRPYFAYLQTTNATTVKSRYEAGDGDEGFRLVAFTLDNASIKLIFKMLESGKVIIGFNRTKNGIDVLVPIDLKVFNAEIPVSGKVVRMRSNDATIQFLECFKELTEQAISEHRK